jgi:hypothetical protein
MVRGRTLSDDLRDVLLHMAQSLDINTITKYTSCKRRTIERIISDFSKMGSVARRHLRKGSLQGRRRAMKGQDVQVSLLPFALFIFSFMCSVCSFCEASFAIALMPTLMKCKSCWRHAEVLM